MFFFGSTAAILPYLCYFIAFWILLFGNFFLSSKFVEKEKNTENKILVVDDHSTFIHFDNDVGIFYFTHYIADATPCCLKYFNVNRQKSWLGFYVSKLLETGNISTSDDRAPPFCWFFFPLYIKPIASQITDCIWGCGILPGCFICK